uniref:Uncharacterized protein n=1 Tax=Anguilla anguilla TaxID=7936 RepID=A0A0E9V9N0_ANGAN
MISPVIESFNNGTTFNWSYFPRSTHSTVNESILQAGLTNLTPGM